MMNLLEMLETADILETTTGGLPGIENAPQGTMPDDYTLVYALPSLFIYNFATYNSTRIYSSRFNFTAVRNFFALRCFSSRAFSFSHGK